MLFNSLAFAAFFTVVFILYWILPHKYRWIFLLLASYFFYMSWNAKYIVLIVFTTIVSYAAALLIEKCRDRMCRRIVLMLGVVTCICVLTFFKYFNFLGNAVASVLSACSIKIDPLMVNVLLPVGISFYTFQTMSYMIDVYRGKVKAERNLGIYAAFISFFPQLVAGPIERTENLLPQIKSEKRFDYDTAMHGIRRMLWGYFKKIAVADVCAIYVDAVYESLTSHTGFDLAIAVFLFTIQIYCDFSGYSDIALGAAEMMGIKLMENFKSPYFSASIREYWSRWHISLSTWFKDYVYIPLGGNRCSRIRHYFNLIVTFLVSGLWHGANWTFVVWGGIHGAAQIVEESCKGILQKMRGSRAGKIMLTLCVFAFCNFAWIFFRAESVADAFYVIRHIFDHIFEPGLYFQNSVGLSEKDLLIILCLIAVVALYDYCSLAGDVLVKIEKYHKVFRILAGYMLVIFIVWGLFYSAGTNGFVYFQF